VGSTEDLNGGDKREQPSRGGTIAKKKGYIHSKINLEGIPEGKKNGGEGATRGVCKGKGDFHISCKQLEGRKNCKRAFVNIHKPRDRLGVRPTTGPALGRK